MSAAELIEHLKALPAGEREAFARLFHKLDGPATPMKGNGKGESPPGKWPDFGARLNSIYGDRVVSDSEAVISHGRGES